MSCHAPYAFTHYAFVPCSSGGRNVCAKSKRLTCDCLRVLPVPPAMTNLPGSGVVPAPGGKLQSHFDTKQAGRDERQQSTRATMSFVSQAFDEVRASLLEASTGEAGGSHPPTRDSYGTASAAGGGTASDPHSRGATRTDLSGRRRVASFFRGDNEGGGYSSQGGDLSVPTVRRRRRGEGTVSRTADTALAALLEGALRRNGAKARDGTCTTSDWTKVTSKDRSVEYNVELLVARAGALASERMQQARSCAGSAPEASSVPHSPDCVAAGAADLSNTISAAAVDGDGHDFFGIGAASSALRSFTTPSRPTNALRSALPVQAPRGCWDDSEVEANASAAISQGVNETEEQVRSLCLQLLERKGDDRSVCDDELGEDQLKLRQDVIRLLVLLSESRVTSAVANNDSVPNQEMEDRQYHSPQSGNAVSTAPFYNIRDVVPMGLICRPVFTEGDIILWSTMALVGVPSPLYRLVGKELVQQPFSIHGESDSTSLFGVTQHFSDAGSNYLYLAGLVADGHRNSSCEAWNAVIHRVKHHWLGRYRVLIDAIKHEGESAALGATSSPSLLDLSVRARTLMAELASLASIICRLSQSANSRGDSDFLDSLYQLIAIEHLSVAQDDGKSRSVLLLLQDLFQVSLKGTVKKLYRKICFGSLNSTSQAGDELRLPSFLGDLSDQIAEVSKCIDLIRESDRSVFARLARFHQETDEGDLFWNDSTDEGITDIIKAQQDHIVRYQTLVQSDFLFENGGSPSSLVGSRHLTHGRDCKKEPVVVEGSSGTDQHASSGTFAYLPVASSWRHSASSEMSQFLFIKESSEEEDLNDANPLSFAGGKYPTTGFFGIPSDLTQVSDDCLTLLDKMPRFASNNANCLPIDILMEDGIKRFIRKHCEITEHFSLLFFVRRSHLLEYLVLVRRIFVGFGCYLTRLISHCFLARGDNPNRVITEDLLRHLNPFCFIASPKEIDLLESLDVNLSLLASEIMSASHGLRFVEHSELSAMQVQCPISSVMDDSAISKYRDIRSFLLRHLWIEEQRKLTWRQLIQMDRTRTGGNASVTPRHLYIIRNEIGHLCSALSQYVNLSLQDSWQKFMNNLFLDRSQSSLGSMKEVCSLHNTSLDDLRAHFFLVKDDCSLARVKGQIDRIYEIALLILEALVPHKAIGDRPTDTSSLSGLWKKYGDGQKALMRSLRIASTSHSFCGDFMELLAGDNAGSHC